ncbi:hypothetical protein GJ496_000154, partial [Pomphorhynchus laevis]
MAMFLFGIQRTEGTITNNQNEPVQILGEAW